MMQGEGARPPSDACDFARYCSPLDFWSINDHAESGTPDHWQATKEAIRQCNAVAGDPANPDMVSFLGWEWTQTGPDRATHFGHKNVMLLETAENKVPTRPIAALGEHMNNIKNPVMLQNMKYTLPLLDPSYRQDYYDTFHMMNEIARIPLCESGVDVHDLPLDCTEVAVTPNDLFAKLDQWELDSIVIPHGTTWGLLTPPGGNWDNQLLNGDHDPQKQLLIEIASGHGNSEEHRNWRAVRFDSKGNPYCPEPSDNYMPPCWKAGDIIYGRCSAAGIDESECESRRAEARQNYANTGNRGHLTVPGSKTQDWLDSGFCQDCFMPAFKTRPGSSAQYALATSGPDEGEGPTRLRFGFIGSTDDHRARPGSTYKEINRTRMSDSSGARDQAWAERFQFGGNEAPEPRSRVVEPGLPTFSGPEIERSGSFMTAGALAAVHSSSRDRGAIWDSLKRKEAYATSGPRILLWFDLLNGPDGEQPMGSAAAMSETPKFRATAVGAFKQKPGCPNYALNSLTPERLHDLCQGECYNPSDERYAITRIEVIRIRPRSGPEESVEGLIETPWRTFSCDGGGQGCTIEFEDEEYPSTTRETVYYVRAVQEPTQKINADAMRCDYDDEGNCIKLNFCSGGWPTEATDACLSEAEDRAWSSPIFVDYDGTRS